MPEPIGTFSVDKPVYDMLNKVVGNFCFMDPNYITIFNMFISIQVVLSYIHNTSYTWVLFIIRCFLDLVDGALARKCNKCTELGNLLDGLSDKVFYVSMMLAILYMYPNTGIIQKTLYILTLFYIIKNFTFSGSEDRIYIFLHDNSLLIFLIYYIYDVIAKL
jgi:phosphatidylglycerophosphate synthase